MIAPAHALAFRDAAHFDKLDPVEALAAAFDLSLWLRPEQRVPPGRWRSFGVVAGRGWGKTLGFGVEINRRVEAGELRPPSSSNDGIALMAPTEDRVRDVQVKAIIETSPPWFRAVEYRGGVLWPNGVRAFPFTPVSPGLTRSGNFELAWLTEIVNWPANTRVEAYNNVTTATRVGARPQVLWDTTSRGKNEIILRLLADHEHDPEAHRLTRGTMFDNPHFSAEYMRAEIRKYGPGTREYDEEILGLVFSEASGALWHQAWIDDHRLVTAPADLGLIILGLDPAISTHEDSDVTGIVAAGLNARDHIAVLDDLSAKLKPEDWADIVCDWHANRGASGCVIERNRGGDTLVSVLRARAKDRGLRIELLTPEAPFPRRTAGRVYVREVVGASAKEARASGPSVLYSQGRVHHVGVLASLEREQTTWVPGSTRASPNRIDALSYAVLELGGLIRDAAPVDLEGAAVIARSLATRLAGRGRGRLGL
jgi:phage terminase large subunit-like protein